MSKHLGAYGLMDSIHYAFMVNLEMVNYCFTTISCKNIAPSPLNNSTQHDQEPSKQISGKKTKDFAGFCFGSCGAASHIWGLGQNIDKFRI